MMTKNYNLAIKMMTISLMSSLNNSNSNRSRKEKETLLRMIQIIRLKK